MWKRSPLISVTNLHKTFRLNIYLLENRNLWTHFKTLNLKTRLPLNQYYLYFPIASTIAYMMVSIFDWVLLGSSVIGCFLGYSVIRFSLGSLVIGSSLVPSMIASSLGSAALVFWYAVCHQLHQQLEGFCNDFLF